MLLGVIADDFTGASDIGNTLAKGLPGEGGLRVAQYFGVPAISTAPDVEAGVISLKSRSIPAEEAVRQSLAALDWLMAQGCRQIVFKYCSTFDSTPEGNIGPVGEALADALGVKGVIACPAFPATGRTVYQGHLFVNGVLLSESGMENHPLNPMTDADLRRWLDRQTRSAVGHLPHGRIAEGPAAVRAALDAAARAGETLVIADAVADADLLVLAEAAADAPLVTGGSGIALGLPRGFIAAGAAQGGAVAAQPVSGREAILAGSCSGATRVQIERHRADHPVMALDVAAVMEGALTSEDVVAFVSGHFGQAPLVYSSDAPDAVAAVQKHFGRETVAARLDGLFGDVARRLVEGGVQRLVVAGGETSGAVVEALGRDAVRIGPEVDPGVPLLYADGARPLALALKSGNFGGPDFFSKALAMMER